MDDGETCPSLRRFGDCVGCPKESVRKAVDWVPCPLSMEAVRLQQLIDAGLAVNAADLSPLVAEALAARAQFLDERRAARTEAVEDEPPVRGLKVIHGWR